MSKMKEVTDDKILMLGKNNIQTLVSDADREIRTIGSVDNAGNSVNLIYGIIHLSSGWDFFVCNGDR